MGVGPLFFRRSRYVPTMLCEQIVVVGMKEFMGGCRYNFPMGKCAQNHAFNAGCALVAQKYAFDRVAGMAAIALNLVAVNVITTVVACCLCFKRRDEARQLFAEHYFRSNALHCTATARILIPAECSAIL